MKTIITSGACGAGIRNISCSQRVLTVLLSSLLCLLAAGPAFGVHLKGNIELDGNTVNNGPSVPGVDDWDNVFAGNDNATRSVFVIDTTVLDTTTFSGSVKDTQSLNQWTCTRAKVQNKSNILHAYAATYVDDGELLFYAGADRESDLGDSNMGVWLFQGPVDCLSNGGATPFVGTHLDGDLLVVSEFDNGGRVEALKVYRWSDPDGIPQNGDECLGGNSGNCSDAGQPAFSGLNCSESNPNDVTCGRTNPTNPINAAWRNNIPSQGMFEMGINLTSQIASTGCFANAIIETRSSTSLTATLKDFVSFKLSTCSTLSVEKTTQGGDGQFDFQVSPSAGGPDEFQLSNGGSIDFPAVEAGMYTIAENGLPAGPNAPFGWSLLDATCTGASASGPLLVDGGHGGGSLSVDIGISDDVVCRFVNEFLPPPGSITVQKICDSLTPDGQTFDFTLSGFGGSSTPACADGVETLACGEAITCLGLNAGAYTVDESPVAGWTVSDVTCLGNATCGADLAPRATITLASQDDAVATFTNTEEASIEICKGTVPAAVGGNFDFTGDINPVSLGDGECSVPEAVAPDFAYDITESQHAGFLLDSINCSGTNWSADAAGTGTVTVTPDSGEALSCTFVNIQNPGYIRVCKNTVTTSDSTQAFQINLSGADPSLPVSATLSNGGCDFGPLDAGALALPAGTGYAVAEPPVDGWDGTVSCIGTEGIEDSMNIDLSADEVVQCTFTNTERGRIIAAKQTMPDGNVQPFQFSGDLAGNVSDGGNLQLEVLAGAYSTTELSAAGWDLDSIICDDSDSSGSGSTANFNVAAGEVVTCTFTNIQRGQIVASKQTIPAGAADSFSFSGDLSGDLIDGNSLAMEVLPGQYSVTEAAEAGWNLQMVDCDDDNSSAVGSTATFNVEAGEVVTCQFTNVQPDQGRIVVFKQTMPDGSNQQFSFSGDLAGSIADGGFIDLAVNAGQYTTTEAASVGWDLDSIVCDDDDSVGSGSTATFNVTSGEVVSCTFTNVQQGQIVASKQTVPAGAADSFNFSGDLSGDLMDGGSLLMNVAPGQYSVTEAAKAGWDLQMVECDDGNSSAAGSTATFNVEAGEVVTCVFTNIEQSPGQGRIVVFKQTIPDGSNQQFSFSGDLAGSIADGKFLDMAVDAGEYMVTEAATAGWDLDSIVCDDDDSYVAGNNAIFNVAADEVVTCTFTNVQRGQIVASKRTIPAGSSESFSFSGDLSGDLMDGESLLMEVVQGQYSVSEAATAGWELQMVECDDDNSSAVGSIATFNVEAGEVVTCVFTNIEKSPGQGRIVVFKQTMPDGSDQQFSFSGDLAGSIADGDFIDLAVSAGQYTTTEDATAGWDLDSIVCDDDDSVGSGSTATFNVANDEVVTCTFINVQRGQIVASKRTVPAGSSDSFSFSGDLSGDLIDGESLLMEVVPGQYSTTEAITAGWDLQMIECDDVNSSSAGSTATFNVEAGEVVTCVFTNIEQSVSQGRIVVQKQTIPDGSSQLFSFSGDLAGSISDGGVIDLVVNAGQYTTTEAAAAGWDLDSIVCDDNNSVGSGSTATFNVSDGETVTCTFTNAQRGRIGVLKTADGPGGQFCFQATGVGLDNDFCIDATSGSGQYLLDNLLAGEYAITEDTNADWTLLSSACSNGDDADAIRLTAGADIVCTFDNEYVRVPPPQPPEEMLAVPVNAYWAMLLLILLMGVSGLLMTRRSIR